MSEKSTMELLLQARFEKLAEHRRRAEQAPSGELKKEVFRTLDLLDTVGEIGHLFTAGFVDTAVSFIDLLEQPEEAE